MSWTDDHFGATMALAFLGGILAFVFVMPLLLRVMSWWFSYICGRDLCL